MPRKAHHKPAQDDTPTHEPLACANHILTSRDGPSGREVVCVENPAPAHCIDERARASWESELHCGEAFRREYRNLETVWGSGPYGKQTRGSEDDKLDAQVKARPGQRSIQEVLRILLRFLPPPTTTKRRGNTRTVLLDHLTEVTGQPTGLSAEREQKLSLARLQQQFEKRGALLAVRDPILAQIVAALALILFDQYRDALRRCTARKPRVAVFGSAQSVLIAARGGGYLGMGSQSLQIAESRGRTRSHWGEVGVRGTTHTGSGSVKSLGAVERSCDAQNAVAGAGLDPLDRAALTEWRPKSRDEMIHRYRRRLAGYDPHQTSEGTAVKGPAPEWLRVKTRELSDDAITERIKRARKAAETHLRRIPEKALAIAMELGDATLAQPWIPPGKERSQKVERPNRLQAALPSEGMSWAQ